MVVCTVCGGEDFAEADGGFYCSVCQTQSQDMRVVEAEDDFIANLPVTTAIRTPKEKQAPKVQLQPLPWTCDEAFLFILSMQSDALMKLGVNKSVKDVIFRLWTTYLSRVGSAFRDDLVARPLRERDKWTGGMKIRRVTSVIRRVAALKAFYGDESSHNECDVEDVDNDGNVDDNDDDNDEDDDVSSTGNDDTSSRSIRTLQHRPLYMTLATTLAICQIATIYTTDLVTCSDFAEWVRKGVLPYYKVIDALPDYIELNAKDLSTFLPQKPMSGRSLRAITGKLLCELGVQTLPYIDVERLICRYVAELDLPAAINGLTAHFYRQTSMKALYELTTQSRQLPSYDAIAVSYIIVIIQLLFGLDDVTEVALSKFAKENESSGERLFVWSEWVEHTDRRLADHAPSSLPVNYEQIKVFDSGYFDGAVTRAMISTRNIARERIINRPGTRTALQNCLRTLLIRSDARLNTSDHSELYFDTPKKTPPTRPKDFRHTSISYIIDVEKFKKSFTGSGGFSILDEDEDEDVDDMVEGQCAPKAYEMYSIQWGDDVERSDSYSWLVESCCTLLGCDVTDVETIKERIELVFFIGYSSQTLNDMRARGRKRICSYRFFRRGGSIHSS